LGFTPSFVTKNALLQELNFLEHVAAMGGKEVKGENWKKKIFDDKEPFQGRGPLHVLTPVKQTLNPCKTLSPHGFDKTLASPAGLAPQRIMCTQGDSNLRPDGKTTKIKALTT
jgi:hypothetical protein